MRERLADELGVGLGVVLEGGYDREVLAECVCATLPVLAGERDEVLTAPSAEPDPITARALAQHARYWPL